jgi:hypothetical protein
MADKAYSGHRPARMQLTHSQEEASRSHRRSRRPHPQETPQPCRPLTGAPRPLDVSHRPHPHPRACPARAPSLSGNPLSSARPCTLSVRRTTPARRWPPPVPPPACVPGLCALSVRRPTITGALLCACLPRVCPSPSPAPLLQGPSPSPVPLLQGSHHIVPYLFFHKQENAQQWREQDEAEAH